MQEKLLGLSKKGVRVNTKIDFGYVPKKSLRTPGLCVYFCCTSIRREANFVTVEKHSIRAIHFVCNYTNVNVCLKSYAKN